MSLTIAFCSFSRVFSSDDFPEFGLPAIATGTPFLIAFPYLNDSFKFSTFSLTFLMRFSSSLLFAKSTSSPQNLALALSLKQNEAILLSNF